METSLTLQRWLKSGLEELTSSKRIQVEEIADPMRPLEIKRFIRRLRETREYCYTADFVR